MQEVKLRATCPKCNSNLEVKTEFPSTPLELAPDVRGAKDPDGCIWKYRITSDDLKRFIVEKAKSFVPDVEVEVIPRYCEKKKRKDYEPHRSYASLRVAFSDKAIPVDGDFGWYGEIGENPDDCRVISTLFQGIIKRYAYNPKQIQEWLKSYKIMETLEDSLGMSETYINDLKMYVVPKRIRTTDDKSFIIFAAAAEHVLADYLTDITTNKLPGKMKIVDVYPISQGTVEWLVELDPTEYTVKENPYVRQLLMGDVKGKK